MRVGHVELAGNLFLAPMAGYSDLAFRLTVRGCTGLCGALPEAGVGLAFTELICASGLVEGAAKTRRLMRVDERDRPLGVQLWGCEPEVLAEAARQAEAAGAAVIDINMGCPAEKVVRREGGGALLRQPELAVRVAEAVVRAVKVPVTCKMRLGWDEGHIVAPELAVRLCGVGVAGVTVHGRTVQQRFGGAVRLEGIAQVVEAVKRRYEQVVVIGNGDVRTVEDVKRMLRVTGCDGVMIGRGALGRPWIFRDAAHELACGRAAPEIPRSVRVEVVLGHLKRLEEIEGPRRALNQMKQRIRWYSAALQPWPGLRRMVNAMRSLEEVREFLLGGLEEIRRREGEGDGGYTVGLVSREEPGT